MIRGYTHELRVYIIIIIIIMYIIVCGDPGEAHILIIIQSITVICSGEVYNILRPSTPKNNIRNVRARGRDDRTDNTKSQTPYH